MRLATGSGEAREIGGGEALRSLDLEVLRAFVTVAETRNFTRAAERLNRGQSAVSMQMKRLEEVTGCRILELSLIHI